MIPIPEYSEDTLEILWETVRLSESGLQERGSLHPPGLELTGPERHSDLLAQGHSATRWKSREQEVSDLMAHGEKKDSLGAEVLRLDSFLFLEERGQNCRI